MNIVRFFGSFDFSKEFKGGLEPNCYYLSKEQAKKGHNVTVISFTNKEERIEEFDGFKVIYLKKPRLRRWFTGPKFLSHIKRKNFSAEVIHSINPTAFSWLFSLAKKNLDSKYVLSIHGSLNSYKNVKSKNFSSWLNSFEYSKLGFFLSKKVDSVITTSNLLKNELITNGISQKKIQQIPTGVDFKLFSKTVESKKSEEFTILYVGRFAESKGVEYLVKSLSLLKDKKIKLILVGGKKEDNNYYYIKKLIKDLLLEKKIELVLPISYTELPKFYQSADIFVLPSVVDGFAKVALEAMASKLPVILTSGAGISEIITNGVNGLIVEPENEVELVKKIELLKEDKSLRIKLARNGFETAKRFDWQKIANQYSNTFEKLINEN